ncbi:hypothetical protein [Oceanihabitans sediminis]|uniref:Uncharacterized protein n=1 Tax=Oceanihabitans sediminis TaxID=1812012 RepID=A0A368P3P7_9FLAO|nr:hypothetical protein [Oceanihabitans sediminis]MDX1277699.1 hypothetical protein [Oceanihabitans sediminis]RBP27737.1 hypothetical protein DFR65_10834 [Oceanihabitans sediminis]RCU56525.1 hypothetical protein DU428_11545 [Oceanihabitans sediminis]
MDTTSTFIGIAIALIIALAIILIQATQKKQMKKSKKVFIDLAAKNNLKITEPEFWGTYYAIAIDEKANKLIYSKIIDDTHNETILDLSTVAKCEVIITSTSLKNKTEIDTIDLAINYKNPSKAKEVLEFYNVDTNFQMNNETELIEKWKNEIESKIMNKAQAA